jgi:hypothetical protein
METKKGGQSLAHKIEKKNEIKFYSNVQIPDRNVEENISKYLNY